MASLEMSWPLWGLCWFMLWTMLLVGALIAVRLRHLSQGGSPMDFGDPTDNKLLWRLYRAQVNCAENLPLYSGAVLLLTVRGLGNGTVDGLAIAYIGARLLHSLIHIAGLHPNLRVTCVGIQFGCLLGLISYGIR